MAYAIKWTFAAVSDLQAAAAYIAQDNPPAAARLVKRILGRIDTAASFPFAQRIVPEFDDEMTREAILNPYRIVYHVECRTEAITILRVWHSARGVPQVD